MSQHDEFDRSLVRWFEAEAAPAATADVLDRALRATSRRRPRPRLFAALGSDWVGDSVGSTAGVATLRRTGMRASMALLPLLLLLVLTLAAGAVLVGARLIQPARVDLGIFAPVAGRIVHGFAGGMIGVDPAAPSDDATRIQLTPVPGVPLGWSSDGTRLLLVRGEGGLERLLVVHADGSEMEVTSDPVRGRATISPDGSRVVFVGEGGLHSVDVDGGPAEVLVVEGSVWALTFSPDGTRIAYVIGRGDGDHSVWLMDADGSDVHQILANEATLGAGHVRGLAWSAGDRIALGLGGIIYTFAPDGSDFTQIAGADTTCGEADPCAVELPKSAESPVWSPDGSEIAYTTGCVMGAGAESRGGCTLAIADADGSNVRTLGFSGSGPWHPAPR